MNEELVKSAANGDATKVDEILNQAAAANQGASNVTQQNPTADVNGVFGGHTALQVNSKLFSKYSLF